MVLLPKKIRKLHVEMTARFEHLQIVNQYRQSQQKENKYPEPKTAARKNQTLAQDQIDTDSRQSEEQVVFRKKCQAEKQSSHREIPVFIEGFEQKQQGQEKEKQKHAFQKRHASGPQKITVYRKGGGGEKTRIRAGEFSADKK